MKLYFKNFEICHNISIYSHLPPIQYFPGAAAEPLGLRGAQVGNLCLTVSSWGAVSARTFFDKQSQRYIVIRRPLKTYRGIALPFPFNVSVMSVVQLCWLNISVVLMFIGPCIVVIVEEWKTNLMSLAILFHFLCAQHVSDINISIIRSLRLCCWITTSVLLFSVRCVLEIWCGWVE